MSAARSKPVSQASDRLAGQEKDTGPDTVGQLAVDREADVASPSEPREIGGPAGLEPTRYGDWERRGRCIDF